MNLDAMRALLAAAEAGMTVDAFTESHGPGGLFAGPDYWHVAGALDGSTDAALSLHGALLPGWPVMIEGWSSREWYAWTDKTAKGPRILKTCFAHTPARALLIATLRGVIAKMEAEHARN